MGTGYSDDCYAQIRIIVLLYASRRGNPDLSEQKQREVQAVEHALEWIRAEYGEYAFEFLRIYCIEREAKQEEAARRAYYSLRYCQRIKRYFYKHIAEELGYIRTGGAGNE